MISGKLSGLGGLSGGLTAKGDMTGELSKPTVTPVEEYDGPYEFTPSGEAQTIEIENHKAIQNITINPIPSNYGLITWNGSTLTVS